MYDRTIELTTKSNFLRNGQINYYVLTQIPKKEKNQKNKKRRK